MFPLEHITSADFQIGHDLAQDVSQPRHTRRTLHLKNFAQYPSRPQNRSFLYHFHWEADIEQYHVGCSM